MPIDPATNQVTYSEVVELPNVSKNELYTRAITWFTRSFKSSKSVLQVEDKEAGKIIGKGNLPIIIKTPIIGPIDAGVVNTTMTIMCKDGKYKYVFDNLYHERPYGRNSQNWVDGGPLEQEKPKVGFMKRPSKSEWEDIKVATDERIKLLIADLKKGMEKSEADF